MHRATRAADTLTKIKGMNVHQLSIAYVPQQDRLLVRVNTNEGQELQVWITRRIALGLSPLLDKAVVDQAAAHTTPGSPRMTPLDQQAKQAIAQFQRVETLQKADFATPYGSSEKKRPIFEQPLVVTDVALTPLGNGQLQLAFAEKTGSDQATRGFQLALGDQLQHAFVHLLERAILQSQWREPVAGAATPEATAPGDGAPPTRHSGYLN